MKRKKARSEIEVYIQGDSMVIYEYFSHDFMEKLIKHAEREFGLLFVRKYRSMCG